MKEEAEVFVEADAKGSVEEADNLVKEEAEVLEDQEANFLQEVKVKEETKEIIE